MSFVSQEESVLTRRQVVTGGVIAGAATVVSEQSGASADQRDASERSASILAEIRDELKRARTSCAPAECAEVERIRTEQRTFIKGRSKFPDYLDVGIEVWERLCDWHVKNFLPLQVSRTAEGRYTMPLFQTFIVLRPDLGNSYIGQGYEK